VIFEETKLGGAFLISPEPVEDDRGFFARTWCAREFRERGLHADVVQCGISFNRLKGTLRGMHFQVEPFAQPKIVRCTMGAIYDVIVDLREASPTWRQWVAVELTDQNRRMLFIPHGFAHGFQSLSDNAEVLYQMGEVYAPESARGVRWNDPAFGIAWPLAVSVIAPRDARYPDYVTAAERR
jgi:dTDP-4-dehydrorhamnose 3,5-epimerase